MSKQFDFGLHTIHKEIVFNKVHQNPLYIVDSETYINCSKPFKSGERMPFT
jgi:hypothetical protein